MSDFGKMPKGGCKSDTETDWNLKGVMTKDCPVTFQGEELNILFKSFNEYEFKNLLPYSGGCLEQPCVLMDGISIVSKVWAEFQDENRG